MREKIIKALLKKCPLGDLTSFESDKYSISCVFIFYQRFHLMNNILHCLNAQVFNKKDFEIIIVEDKGGSKNGEALKSKFQELNIEYFAPDKGWGKMGFMRNYGLSKAKGEIILFLDDDTVILDLHFLDKLVIQFKANPYIDAILPEGKASLALLEDRYQFHDPFFFTNRCTAYRKDCLKRLKGFDSNFIGQEDVELAIRFYANRCKHMKTSTLLYYHPPLICDSSSKSVAVGSSFARSKYNPLIKSLLLLNGSRWLLRFCLPGLKNKYLANFAMGFFKGFLHTILGKQKQVHYQ